MKEFINGMETITIKVVKGELVLTQGKDSVYFTSKSGLVEYLSDVLYGETDPAWDNKLAQCGGAE